MRRACCAMKKLRRLCAAVVFAAWAGAVAAQAGVDQNRPNDRPVVPGGVAARQLAASDSALDKMLFAAIESSNVEDVKSALSAGINLQQDYAFGCPLGKGPQPSDDEAWQRFTLRSGKVGPGATPGRCAKQHLLHALGVAASRFPGGVQADILGLAQADRVAALSGRGERGGAEMMASITPAAERGFRAFEVLALIDANVPVADKALYPAALANTGFMSLGSPLILVWTLERYYAALPDIRRARALKEPARSLWDLAMAKMEMARKGRGIGGQAQVVLFDPAALPGGDERSSVKAMATHWILSSGYAPDLSCDMDANFQNAFGRVESRHGPYFVTQQAQVLFAQRYLSDDVGFYTREGLDALPYSAMEQELMRIGASQKNPYLWSSALQYRASRSMVAYLMSKPDIVAALGNEQPQPIGQVPPLHQIMWGMKAPGLVRALLDAGVSPKARAPDGKTALDLVLDGSALGQWRARPFTQTKLSRMECRPRG